MSSLAQDITRNTNPLGLLSVETTLDPNLTALEKEDAELVAAISRYERGAENKFVRRFRAQTCSMLIRMTSDPSRAEDLTHDTLLLVLKKLRDEEISKPHKLTSYVMSTAKFTFYGWLRKKDNQLELRESLNEYVNDLNSPEEQYIRGESSEEMRTLVNDMTVSRDREIITRRYFEDQCKSEICEVMELSKEHYDRVISRARYRLKESMNA